jgi:glycosyltransferase involved in cell wall biosynthesis
MSATPPFSVLMSVYAKEQPEHLATALESLFAQTLPPDEVVLVKDGPLTAALDAVITEAAARHPELRAVGLERNVGLGAALNAGLRHCRHELVARMDSDDLCTPDRFQVQIPLFAADGRLAVVGGWITEFERDPADTHSVRRVPESHEAICTYAKTRCPVNHATVVFRKSAVEAVGGYNAKHLQEDYYLWARMLLAGHRFHNVQQPVLHVRTGEGQFGRRGGLRYAQAELKLLAELRRLGFLDTRQFLVGVLSRTTVRLLPSGLRKSLYLRFARSRAADT